MKKIFNTMLLLIMLQSTSFGALDLDFTTYTEYNAEFSGTITTDSISVTNFSSRDTKYYVYDTQATENFRVNFKLNYTSWTNPTGFAPITFTNAIGDVQDWAGQELFGVYMLNVGAGLELYIHTYTSGAVLTSDRYMYTLGEDIYGTLVKDGTTMYCKWYSTANRDISDLLATHTLNPSVSDTYQYIVMTCGNDNATAGSLVTGAISEVEEVIAFDFSDNIQFVGNNALITGHCPTGTVPTWANATTAGNGNTTVDGTVWTATVPISIAIDNAVTVSVLGFDIAKTVRNSTQSDHSINSALIIRDTTSQLVGPSHQSLLFDGNHYWSSTWDSGLNFFMGGEDDTRNLTFSASMPYENVTGDAPTALENVSMFDESRQKTYRTVFTNTGSWVSRLLTTDDTPFFISALISGSDLYEEATPSDASLYTSVTNNVFNACYISGVSSAGTTLNVYTSTSSLIFYLQGWSNIYTTTVTSGFGHSNLVSYAGNSADAALSVVYNDNGTLYHAYKPDVATAFGTAEVVTTGVATATSFRAIQSDDGQLYVFYKKSGNLYRQTRSVGVGGTWGAETLLVSTIDAFSASSIRSKDDSFAIFYTSGTNLYRAFLDDKVLGTSYLITASMLTGYEISSPFFDPYVSCVGYYEADSYVLDVYEHVIVPRTTASALKVISTSKKEAYPQIITLSDTSFNKAYIGFVGKGNKFNVNTYDFDTEELENEFIPQDQRYWDLHNSVVLSLSPANEIVLTTGGREQSSFPNLIEHDLDVFESLTVFTDPSFNADINQWADQGSGIPAGRGYSQVLVDGNGITYTIYMIGVDIYVSMQVTSGFWYDILIHDGNANVTGTPKRTYWEGGRIIDEGAGVYSVVMSYTLGADSSFASSQSVVNTNYVKLTRGTTNFTAYRSTGEVMSLPLDETKYDNIISSKTAIDTHSIVGYPSYDDRVQNNLYTAGTDYINYGGRWWECTVTGTSENTASPAFPANPEHRELYVDGTATWREGGLINLDIAHRSLWDTRSSFADSNGYVGFIHINRDVTELIYESITLEKWDGLRWNSSVIQEDPTSWSLPSIYGIEGTSVAWAIYGYDDALNYKISDDLGATWPGGPVKLTENTYEERNLFAYERSGSLDLIFESLVSETYSEIVISRLAGIMDIVSPIDPNITVDNFTLGVEVSFYSGGVASVGWVDDHGGSGALTGSGTDWETLITEVAEGNTTYTITAISGTGETVEELLTVSYIPGSSPLLMMIMN